MKRFSLRYSVLTSKIDQLWFPVSIFALFVIMGIIMKDAPQFLTIARGYLGVAIPLIAGILSAYAVLEDPALELRFATPIPTAQTLLERLSLVFIVQAVLAVVYQLFIHFLGGQFSMFISIWHLQLAWLIPTLALMMLGCVCSLLAANSTIGALIVGMVWLVELIARGWFAQNTGKYFLVFMAALMPDHPNLNANMISLFVLSILSFVVAVFLLRRRERFIK
jgi:hypothetical protein